MTVEVTTTTTRSAAEEAGHLHARVIAVVKSAMNGANGFTATAREKMRANDQIVTGQMRRATIGSVEEEGDVVHGVVHTEAYGPYQEWGTKPHRPPIYTSNGGGILPWVVRKGLVDHEGRELDHAERLRMHSAGEKVKNTGQFRSAFNLSADEATKRVDAYRAGEAIGGKKITKRRYRAAALRQSLRGTYADDLRLNTQEAAQLRLAYRVAAGIARRGTRVNPFMAPGVDAAFGKLVLSIDRILAGGLTIEGAD